MTIRINNLTKYQPVDLAPNEGSNDTKNVSAPRIMTNNQCIAEAISRRYANSINCVDNGSIAAALRLFLQSSQATRGIVNNGEYYRAYDATHVWEKACVLDDAIELTDADLVQGAAVADYRVYLATANIDFVVFQGNRFERMGASGMALSTDTGGINATDAMIMKLQSTSPVEGAGAYGAAGQTLEARINAINTSYDVGHNLAGAHRAGSIGYASLAENALVTVRVNLLAPFGEMYPAVIAGGLQYPPLWRNNGAAPSAIAPYTTLADLLGNANLLSMTLDASTSQGIRSNALAPDQARVQGFRGASVQLYVTLKKTGGSGAGKPIIYVNDNVTGDTSLTITPTTTMTLYSLATAALIDAAATTMEVGIKHSAADAAACSLLINEFWAEITAPFKFFAENPYFRVHKIELTLAGNMAAGPTYFLFGGGATCSTTFGPKVAGKIVGCAFDVQLGTAVGGAGSTVFDVRLNGGTVATLTLAGASAATQDAAAYTPASPPTIGVPAVQGARFMVRCTAIAATPGADATFTGYIITLA